MTKQEAIEAMVSGKKVSHKWFTPDEWMKMEDDKFIFEDDCRCTPREFWQQRVDESWENDWRIISE